NYLLPVGSAVDPANPEVSMDKVLRSLSGAPDDAVKIVVLDACRVNADLPVAGGGKLSDVPNWSPGLAKQQQSVPPTTLFQYAASYGQIALSGTVGNLSPYTGALVGSIREPGLEIRQLLARVHDQVFSITQRQQSPNVEGIDGLPSTFYLKDPVYIDAVSQGGHADLVVILNGEVAFATNQPLTERLYLNARENEIVLFISSPRTYRNNHDWDFPEGWNYQLDLMLPKGPEILEGHEDTPFKNGPHFGRTFMVARVHIYVNPESAEVSILDRDTDMWKHESLESPRWSLDQELLFQVSISDLNLTPDDILSDALDLGTISAAVLRPFLVEFLKSGTVLGQTIAEPSRTFLTVWGNRELKSYVETAMIQGRDDRIRDLKASIAEVFKRNPTPFKVFDDRLIEAVQSAAVGSGIPVEAIKAWTALHVRSDEEPAAVAPANASGSPVSVASHMAAIAAQPSLMSVASGAPTGILQPRPDEVPVGPIPFSQTVRGITLSTPVSFFLSFNPQGSQILVNARILADLSDLQRKVGSLVDTIPLPSDRCAHTGVDNLVARIWGKDITIAGNVATLTLHGDVDVWGCLNVFGLHQEKQIGNQPFDATLPFSAAVADPHTIAAHVGQPSITLGGQFGSVTQWLLGSLGVNLNAMAREALNGFLSPELLRQTLPNDLLTLNPDITRAELMSNSGALVLYVEMSASFDGTALGKLIRSIFVGS
ncbi:MAG TPA: caspase family protein, partial [Thermoanaerobaculia bacterium]